MIWSPTVVTVYGIFCIIGGLIGFFKAESLVSLYVGGIGGIILVGCGVWMFWRSRIAAFLVLLISLAFGIRFLIALIGEFRVMPHLLMVILSAAAIVAALFVLSAGGKERRGR